MRNRVRWAVLLAGLTVAAISSAQETNPPMASNQINPANLQMTQHMQEMDTMARSMTSMADVCRMMMEKEMRSAPLRIGAIVGIGSLFLIALILFIVLEVQWIRFWILRTKTERMKVTGSRSP